MLVPAAAVGADGIPVNVGDAIVALKAISFVFVVILDVFEATLVLSVVMSLVFVVIFVLFVAISVVFVAILFAFVVILDVFDAIKVGNVPMVDELTPPTLFTEGKSAVPPRSFVNLIFPLAVDVASGVAAPPTNDETNSVVAN